MSKRKLIGKEQNSAVKRTKQPASSEDISGTTLKLNSPGDISNLLPTLESIQCLTSLEILPPLDGPATLTALQAVCKNAAFCQSLRKLVLPINIRLSLEMTQAISLFSSLEELDMRECGCKSVNFRPLNKLRWLRKLLVLINFRLRCVQLLPLISIACFRGQVVEEENPVEVGCFEQLDNFHVLSELEWSGTGIDDSHIKVLSKLPVSSARFNLSDQLRGTKFEHFPFSTLESKPKHTLKNPRV